MGDSHKKGRDAFIPFRDKKSLSMLPPLALGVQPQVYRGGGATMSDKSSLDTWEKMLFNT